MRKITFQQIRIIPHQGENISEQQIKRELKRANRLFEIMQKSFKPHTNQN